MLNGIVEYTAEDKGTLKLTAEKEGYTTVNKNVNVIPPKEEMSLSVSPETVYIGDNNHYRNPEKDWRRSNRGCKCLNRWQSPWRNRIRWKDYIQDREKWYNQGYCYQGRLQ